MNNIAIIPARGGSKRIPKKNIKDFLGKPIIAYSIEAAIKSELFDIIMVSTDDVEIAEIAERYGAKVPFFRSGKNSNDDAPLADVVEEVIKYYKKTTNFDNACCILSTAPFITVNNLRKGLELLKAKKFDSVRPVVRFSYPIQKALKLESNCVEFLFPDSIFANTQDLAISYHDSGQFYWMSFDKGLKGGRRGGFEIDELYTQDIDTITDWKIAEQKYTIMEKANSKE